MCVCLYTIAMLHVNIAVYIFESKNKIKQNNKKKVYTRKGMTRGTSFESLTMRYIGSTQYLKCQSISCKCKQHTFKRQIPRTEVLIQIRPEGPV